MLSCSCPDWEFDDEWEGWLYYGPSDFSVFDKKRRKRCCSCKELIDIDSLCLEFGRTRYPRTEIEDRIYGEGNEIEIASYFMCDKCGEQYLNLEALGYCIDITDNMFDLLEEYQEMTRFKK